MTPAQIAQRLLETSAKATSGPWEYDADENEVHMIDHREFSGDPLHLLPPYSEHVIQCNGPFIATANPNAIKQVMEAALKLAEVVRITKNRLKDDLPYNKIRTEHYEDLWLEKVEDVLKAWNEETK